MAGAWPNLDAADLEARVRTYLNEVGVDFVPQSTVWRWLTIAANVIAEVTGCVRRVLDSEAIAGSQLAPVPASKILYVEYIPTSGRSSLLSPITPLQVGHFPYPNGVLPQYWFEFGSYFGIDPVPASNHRLRLFVSDAPRIIVAHNIPLDSGWAAGTGWAAGMPLVHTGTPSGDYVYSTVLSGAIMHTVEVTVSTITGTLTPAIGAQQGYAITTAGHHFQNIMAPATNAYFTLTATGSVEVVNVSLDEGKSFDSVADQTELSSMWQHLLAVSATRYGLLATNRLGAAQLLEHICAGEFAYLEDHAISVIPNGQDEMRYSE